MTSAEHWRRACRALIAKMLAELSFEHALYPEPLRGARYRVTLDTGVRYEFAAHQSTVDNWLITQGSVTRDGRQAEDPVRLLLDLHEARQLDPERTALSVAELTGTLSADAYLLRTGPGVAELAELAHPRLAAHLTGHPRLIANKGRIGLSATDRHGYAPESALPHRLFWIAVHPDLAEFHGVSGVDNHALIERELDPPTRREFSRDPGGFLWLPVHPWQWDEAIVPLYAAELAAGLIMPLGEAPDRYLAQQPIRTLVNVDRPDRLDVTLALSIRDAMGYQGIPADLARTAAPVTRWLTALRDRDPFLRDACRVILSGDIAAAAVRHPALDRIGGAPEHYTQLLGALWREPLAAQLDPGERARPLAALPHLDPTGQSLAVELIRRSALAPVDWLRRLFAAVLPPVLHYLYRYGLALSPHDVTFDDQDVPVRAAFTDLAGNLTVLTADIPEYAGLPSAAWPVLHRATAPRLGAALADSLFAGVFRYLAPLLAGRLGVPEAAFWSLARAELLAYQARFPELAERFALVNLLAPTFERLCPNRDRLLPGGAAAPPLTNPLLG